MSNVRNITKGLIVFMSILLSVIVYGQKKEANLSELIQNRKFDFKAESVQPSRGSYRILTPEFDLKLRGDTLISYLPFFGESYAAPIDQTKGPLDFISTRFDYKYVARKKGGWEITIQLKDNSDIRQIYITVSSEGNGTLSVNSNNEQPTSFNGYIAGKK